MKRSSSDAGLPPNPRQLQIPAIPIFNPFAIQPPPPPTPLPPTMTTVQRPAIAAWPQPNPAFYTFAANQAYPPRPSGLPVSTAVPHGMRFASRPPTSNLHSAAPSFSSGRYKPGEVAGKTELTIKLATRDDLIELADTLRHPHTVNKISVITSCPEELRGTFEAICTSTSPLDLVVSYGGPRLGRSSLNKLFSSLTTLQAPLKSLRWVNTTTNVTSQEISQRAFESLCALQLLESFHFSGLHAGQSRSVDLSDAKQWSLSLEKNGSLRSISMQRTNGAAFISGFLQDAAKSQTLENIHLEYLDLTPLSETLLAVLDDNRNLKSVSVKGCQLAFGTMTQILRSIQQHPGLQSLDFSKAQIPHDELQFIGEPIQELLVTNNQLNELLCCYTTSPVNIKALTLGLEANTTLSSFTMEALGHRSSSAANLSEINTRSEIDHLFKSNKGLRQIVIQIPSSRDDADYSILRGLGENTSIESLTIENLTHLDEVIDLMTHHPQFKHLTLTTGQLDYDEKIRFSHSMWLLAGVLKDNKNLLNFSFIDHSRCLSNEPDNQIFRIDNVTTRNRIRRMAPLAGAVMSRRQDLMPNVPGALPPLPPEINQLLFEATVDYISPNDAQTLYNTVLPFTPLPGNQ
jgi:hypothetical protein